LEEFQVLHSFLSSLRIQKEAEIWGYQNKNGETSDEFKAKMMVALAQRNMIAMLENLPMAVDSLEMVLDAQKKQKDNFAKSQS